MPHARRAPSNHENGFILYFLKYLHAEGRFQIGAVEPVANVTGCPEAPQAVAPTQRRARKLNSSKERHPLEVTQKGAWDGSDLQTLLRLGCSQGDRGGLSPDSGGRQGCQGDSDFPDDDRGPGGSPRLAEGHQVTHVAMESTGIYWRPVFNLLEEDFAVLLVNAAHIKAVQGERPT